MLLLTWNALFSIKLKINLTINLLFEFFDRSQLIVRHSWYNMRLSLRRTVSDVVSFPASLLRCLDKYVFVRSPKLLPNIRLSTYMSSRSNLFNKFMASSQTLLCIFGNFQVRASIKFGITFLKRRGDEL